MAEPVIYIRGNGGYTLSESEQQTLDGLQNTLEIQVGNPATQSNEGLGVAIYRFLLDVITEEYEIVDPGR